MTLDKALQIFDTWCNLNPKDREYHRIYFYSDCSGGIDFNDNGYTEFYKQWSNLEQFYQSMYELNKEINEADNLHVTKE